MSESPGMSKPSGHPEMKTTFEKINLRGPDGNSPVPSRFDLGECFARKEELLIGRNPTSDIWLDHPAVSRTHASLRRGTDGNFLVKDLKSTHGITLDGKPVTGEVIWKPGETLHLGPQALWLEDGNTLLVKTSRGVPKLEASGLTVSVPGRDKPILDQVSFSFNPGQFVCVLGPSGAGKSTLVRCMQGLQDISGGSLHFGGHQIHSNPAILNGLVGYAPQKMSLHETLTVREVVWFAAKLRLPTDTTPREIDSHVDVALESMGIQKLGDQRISSLSGGERKRVELASELVVDPSILLVDEATSSLDPASEARVMEVLAGTAKQGKLVLCVTHHLDNIAKADTLLILGDGKVVYLGPPAGACAHFGVEHLSDAFVRMEDEGVDKWAIGKSASASQSKVMGALASVSKKGPPRRSFSARVREAFRQTAILIKREVAAVCSDRSYLFLVGLMPALFALVIIFGHWSSNLSVSVLLTREMNSEEKDAFAYFWPIIHDAAQGKVDKDDVLTVQGQLAYLLGNRPDLRKNLASDNLDTIIRSAIDGKESIFPEKFVKNHLTTLKYLAVQVMGLTFMGMLFGLTLIVRDGDIFKREKALGLSPIAYLLSKVSILIIATGFQTIVFDGLLELLFQVRKSVNGLETIPAEYRIGFMPMVLVHWATALGCACLGLFLGALTRKSDRAIILLGAMMVVQLMLGSALGLAVKPLPKAVAFVVSPTYWGLRSTQISPMENGIVALPSHLRVFGDSFIQSVPLALAGLSGQILLYLIVTWWLLRSRNTVKD